MLKINSVTRSIALLGLVRCGNIGVQLLLIPISIKFINTEYFGVWLTLSSIILLLNIFDLGMGNGLRNKLAVSIINGNDEEGRSYISTTYFFLGIIAIIGFVISYIVSQNFDWNQVLTVPDSLANGRIQNVIGTILMAFFASFFLKPIFAVSYAIHRPFIEPLITLLGNLGCLIIISILVKIKGKGSIEELAFIYCLSPLVFHFCSTIFLYLFHFKKFRPSIRNIDFALVKPLMGLSAKFFVIQVAATLVISATNFVVSKFFGNRAVTDFNIVQRYFSIILIVQAMILTPYWNLITDSYERRDVGWLTSTFAKLLRINLFLILGIMLMIIFADIFLEMWIGSDYRVSRTLLYMFAINTVVYLFSSLFTTFINGTGKVKLQMFTAIITCFVYVPFLVICAKGLKFEVVNILIGSTLWLLSFLPLRYWQYRHLIRFEARKNLWNS